MKHTVKEVRAIAKRLHDDITVRDDHALKASAMLTAYADSIERAQAGVTESVRVAGAMLANCAFNLAQCDRLTEREHRSLDESRKAWDAAIAASSVPTESAQAAQVDSANWFAGKYPTTTEPAQPTDSGRAGNYTPEQERANAIADKQALIGTLAALPPHVQSVVKAYGAACARTAADGALAAQGQGEAVAWLHTVTQGDGETDQALSFSPDSFPLDTQLGFRSLGSVPLYTRPATAASPAGAPDGWSGWCTQYPDRLPKLWGAREIAELNHYPEEGQRMFQVVEVAAAPSAPEGDA